MLPDPVLDRSVRLEDDAVLILDRRVFPHRVEWVAARSDVEVAAAIRDMVTQSLGPCYAAAAGLILVARQQAGAAPGTAWAALRTAGERLTAADEQHRARRGGGRDGGAFRAVFRRFH